MMMWICTKKKNHPTDANSYVTPAGYRKYDVRKKTIQVKDSTSVSLNVKISRHGPVINDLIEGLPSKNPIAMSWIYTQQPIQILDAVYLLSHAKNKADFQKGVSLIAAPGLNVMYGDAKGNVAWWATGKLYKHQAGVNPNFILDGASGKNDIATYLDFSKNPSAVNPRWNYVYSANNQPEAVDGFSYPGYYLPEDRAKRITQLLDPKSDWDKASVGSMIFDNTSATAPSLVKNLLPILENEKATTIQKEALSVLKTWKGSHNLNDVAPTIYNKFLFCYLKNTFEDELGTDRFKSFLGTHIMRQVVVRQLATENSIWWDNSATKNKIESRKDILSLSFAQAIAALESQFGSDVATWTWNKVHTVEHQHPLGKVAALRNIFNVGPFEVSGTNEVINNLFFDYTADGNYLVKGGPSTRRIIDFSDIENSWSVLPTGQSGNVLSSHYSDQAELYNTGKFRRMILNKEEIVRSSSKLVFKVSK